MSDAYTAILPNPLPSSLDLITEQNCSPRSPVVPLSEPIDVGGRRLSEVRFARITVLIREIVENMRALPGGWATADTLMIVHLTGIPLHILRSMCAEDFDAIMENALPFYSKRFAFGLAAGEESSPA